MSKNSLLASVQKMSYGRRVQKKRLMQCSFAVAETRDNEICIYITRDTHTQ